MKRDAKPVRRQVFVLTPDEKRAAACVLGAFLLGLATMHYRATHPRTPPEPVVKEQQEGKRATRRTQRLRASPAPPAPGEQRHAVASEEDSGDE